MRRSFWDLAYQFGDEHEHWDAPRFPAEVERWLRDGLIRGRVLDLGCGTGTELLYLDEQLRSGDGAGQVELHGIDRSLTGLARAGRRAAAKSRFHWTAADATQLPVRSAAIDVLLDRGCLHVVSRRLRRRYAREVARVIGCGGHLLLRGARRRDPDAGYEPLPPDEIGGLFIACGFSLVSMEPIVLEARAADLDAWAYCFRREGRVG